MTHGPEETAGPQPAGYAWQCFRWGRVGWLYSHGPHRRFEDADGSRCLFALVLSGARDGSECGYGCDGSAAPTAATRRLRRKQAPCHGGLTRAGAQRLWREHRNPAWCVAGPAGRASRCGAVAVVVVTARRAGTRSWKPRGARTRDIDTPAQPGDRRESERSERPGEQDCRYRAQAERTRLVRRGGRSR